MIEISREEFKKDPVFRKVYEHILKIHSVPNHTANVLFRSKHIKDFCEEARHFVIMKGNPDIFMHYDVASWYNEKNGGASVKIDAIVFYDDFIEFETARVRGLHSTKDSDIPNIN